MTQTAKRLFLSQQTLSNHIARLEKWCGIPLFYRKLTDPDHRRFSCCNLPTRC